MIEVLDHQLKHFSSGARQPAMQSPFARLGLRRNPFGELTRAERAAIAVVEIEPWIEALGDTRTALQFIGDKGHGKTTHLLAIHHALPRAEYIYFPEAGPPPSIPKTRPLFIDEAQRLSRWARWSVLRRGGPLVLGTHEDLSAPLQRAGFHVTTVDVAKLQSAERLVHILNRRIAASRLGNAAVSWISVSQAEQLIRKFGGDIRAIENHLYDLFQTAAQRELPWPLVT